MEVADYVANDMAEAVKEADIVVLEQVENFIPKLLSVEILKD